MPKSKLKSKSLFSEDKFYASNICCFLSPANLIGKIKSFGFY